MSKFTKGPWRIGFDDGSGLTYITTVAIGVSARFGSDMPYVVVSGPTDDWGIEQGVLNPDDARLIAKAPDMLEMLIDIVRGGMDACRLQAIRALILEAGGEL